MKLLIGLGNPGPEYQRTWHNLGFLLLDELYAVNQDHFKPFRADKRRQTVIAAGTIDGEAIILAKPQTFMNNSGEAVNLLTRFYGKKITAEDIWVLHDDIDLPLGKIKISRDASAGGHRGVQSIIDHLGRQSFIRFRLGIEPASGRRAPTEAFVLQKITNSGIVEQTLSAAVGAIQAALADGVNAAMNRYN